MRVSIVHESIDKFERVLNEKIKWIEDQVTQGNNAPIYHGEVSKIQFQIEWSDNIAYGCAMIIWHWNR